MKTLTGRDVSSMMARIPLALAALVALSAATTSQQRGAMDEPGGRILPPEGEYEISVRRSIMVPMRDGVELSTDLYFPEGAG
ncbi:MAG TPA: hypothetical protein QGG47_01645, partial [Acidobacteriota bacterium]|nr:hypothetical protein [Acidobacteriota bacterium]